MHIRTAVFIGVICCFITTAPAASAQSNPFDPMFACSDNCIDRLATGLDNVVLGWTDVLVYSAEGLTQRDTGTPVSNLLYHLPVGLSRGSAAAVGRTAQGIFQTATFLIPKFDFRERKSY